MTKFERFISLLVLAQELEEIDPQLADLTDDIAQELVEQEETINPEPNKQTEKEVQFQNILNDLNQKEQKIETQYDTNIVIDSAVSAVAESMLETNMNFDAMPEEEFNQRLIQNINLLF